MKVLKRCMFLITILVFSVVLLLPLHTNAASKPTLNKKRVILAVGQKKTLKVKNTTKKIQWKTSNKKVVKVSKQGVIRGVKKGKATITAKVGKQKLTCKVTVKDAVYKINETVKIQDAGYVLVYYISDTISIKNYDPDIASVYIAENGPAEDGPGREATLAIYGHKKGTITLTVTNNCNNQKMKFKVRVRTSKVQTREDKLIRYIINQGQLDEDSNKYISLESSGENNSSTKAMITYDFWDKELDFRYLETNDNGTVEWSFLTYDNSDEQDILVWIGKNDVGEKEFVTAHCKIAEYAGETLAFENGWYGTAAEDELQIIANEATKNAVAALDELLEQINF